MKEFLKYEEKASRTELFVRIFYSIPVGIILYLYAILAGVCQVLLWIVILITGKRVESLSEVVADFLKYNIQVISYLNLITDERPGITPKDIKIFIEKYEDEY
ncbi:DUF4389 domain-containing protein [Methanobrevibacter filiformis]|uniref:DUF4389 domain-containing protein n=1 Tax=Methanobrevibacter filiformis TaxID=55758 RepID=A0A165ZWI2_9EURY|nr:DUF4389 domain-containing protein [Methanobrevibacter filiformis]KZX11259.1 hypothetical protein MBFIL_14970 [Methanobrevibacter filiformis]